MKKIVLLFMVAALCATLLAQHKVANTKELFKGVACKQTISASVGDEQILDFIPNNRPSFLQSKSSDPISIIGETHYNSPTNNCARNTVSFRPNTYDIAAVWTMAPGTDPLTSPMRGTGINYNIDRSWGNIPSTESRIEDMRTGWGIHAFTENGEITVAHNGTSNLEAGLVVCTRDNWGEGDWEQYTLLGPEYMIAAPRYDSPEIPTTGLMWPSMATNGDIVHLICVTEQWGSLPTGMDNYPEDYASGYLGFSTVPLYYRSTDGGKNWDIKAFDFRSVGMTDIEVQRTSADAYSIAVRGDHVVFVYHELYHYIHYMESYDGGDTWVKKDVYDFDFDWSPNTWQQPRLVASSAAIYIDDTDRVHVAFGTRLHARAADQEENWYTRYTVFPTGIVYWNDDSDPLTWRDLSANTVSEGVTDLDMESEDQWAFKTYPGYIEVPSVLGFDKYYYWEQAPLYTQTQFRDLGFSIFPRILAKDGNVYVAYQTALEYPLFFDGTPANILRGIFVTVSLDDGKTMDSYNNTSWVSYHPTVFFCKWDDYDGPYYDANGEPYWNGSINVPWSSENAYPTMSINTGYNDNFVIQWFNQYEPFLTNGLIVGEAVNVFSLVRNLSIFPDYANIREVYTGAWNDIGISENPGNIINTKIFPNPSSDGKVFIETDAYAPYTVTVTNIMGQVVLTMQGQQFRTELNVSNFTPGIYLVNVKTKSATSTQKLIVK